MFHLYWPVMALVAATVLVVVLLVLMLGGRTRLCGRNCIRTDALPDRPLKTYLPEKLSLITVLLQIKHGSKMGP